MCHNRYIEYTLMYIGYIEYNEYSFMYFITNAKFSFFDIVNSRWCFLHIEMTQEANLPKFKSEVESSQVLAYLACDTFFMTVSILQMVFRDLFHLLNFFVYFLLD